MNADDVKFNNIHEFGVLVFSRFSARETTEISHTYFNWACSKSMGYHYLISLDDKENTREAFQEEQRNKFCLLHDFNSTTQLFFYPIFHLPVCVQLMSPPQPIS